MDGWPKGRVAAGKIEGIVQLSVNAMPPEGQQGCFAALGLLDALQRAVHHEGYERPTPIQEQAIPHVLEGRDLLGCAQTGTGKTAAFALPILQRLAQRRGRCPIRALVLSPTRELAAQIGERFGAYGRDLGLRHAIVYGGVSQFGQERALRQRPDVLVATPGRLLDLIAQRLVDLSLVEIFVLDEADRMLDMGFIHDVKKIVAQLPKERQTLLFSATMPKDIEELAQSILKNPVRVAVNPVASTAHGIEQRVYFVSKREKRQLLEHVLETGLIERALVFTRTKHGADRVARQLARARIASGAIHGDKTQNQRERALEGFRRGSLKVLVATDIAARGIDVEGISHVVNYDLPNDPTSYVHRIGRTGRAGASGVALSFCDIDERPLLRNIERLVRTRIAAVSEHPFLANAEQSAAPNDGRRERRDAQGSSMLAGSHGRPEVRKFPKARRHESSGARGRRRRPH
jgi:ATP-dependent RNA helicase RhlE